MKIFLSFLRSSEVTLELGFARIAFFKTSTSASVRSLLLKSIIAKADRGLLNILAKEAIALGPILHINEYQSR